jgi:S-adenosylmethionine hydrolase
MPIVTLTTDTGLQNYYSALIKGTLYGACPQVQIVDVSSNINNYDIVQAAYVLRHAWKSFPPATIHLIGVNDLASAEQRFLLVQQNNHYFVAPNNGIFSLLFDNIENQVYELPWPEEGSFPIKDIFARTVSMLAEGADLADIGQPTTEIIHRITLQPVVNANQIRGTIIFVDEYENTVVNVTRELFEHTGKGRDFTLHFKRHDPIKELSQHYYDVPIGEVLCLFNSAGYLEIAINLGKASSLLGLKLEDSVQVDFRNE